MKSSNFFFVISLILVLSGCGLGTAEKGRKPSPDWSRGLPLSTSVSGSVGMAVAGDGERIHFVWPTAAAGDQTLIHYQQLDSLAETTADHDLELPSGRLRAPRLLLAGEDQAHLFWSRRPDGSKGWELWHALLDSFGNLAGSPTRLSPAEMNIGSYVAAQNRAGNGFIVWEDNETGSLYGLQVVGTAVDAEPVLLVLSGESPAIQVDETGTLYLAWIDEALLFYAALPDGRLGVTGGARVADLIIGAGDSVKGLALGVTNEWVSIFWSIYKRSGEEAGAGLTEYVSFPVGAAALTPPTRLGIMTVEDQPYRPYQGAYPLTQLAPPPPSAAFGSNYTLEPDTAAGQGSELAVVVSTNQQFRLNTFVQMAVVLFRDGQFQGYQMAAKTESFSHQGALVADQTGNLHLAWREGGGGRKLYYATTSPETRAEVDRLRGADIINALLAGSMESVVGILFFPLALGWLLPGVLLLGLWKLKRDEDSLTHPLSIIFLLLAIVLYQGTKILFLPTITSYTPFSAWLDISASWSWPLRVGTPLLIFGLGLLAAELLRRRKQEMSPIFYFVVAAGNDALLTLAVYGVNFLGVI